MGFMVLVFLPKCDRDEQLNLEADTWQNKQCISTTTNANAKKAPVPRVPMVHPCNNHDAHVPKRTHTTMAMEEKLWIKTSGTVVPWKKR
jgi:hypothetical protein